ncbi:hypothetical protein NEILACOT_03041 [Neisseria lactamica ATCC 23970]|uniref:Uncharacterized protein n=1 Tax=Neisseria lactamica ATCC 23970 TaxID=546265 RepID=D0W6A4_NEILA|nr:hypothetical protein NEILACOT_03041 [Neisseria lactamica ATCC 23970]
MPFAPYASERECAFKSPFFIIPEQKKPGICGRIPSAYHPIGRKMPSEKAFLFQTAFFRLSAICRRYGFVLSGKTVRHSNQ